MARKPARPSLFDTFDVLYNQHYETIKGFYSKGVSIMIDSTINKMTCITCVAICDKEIDKIKPVTTKSPYSKDRYTDDLAYWVTLRELFKNKMF